jgi:hypothetical protein
MACAPRRLEADWDIVAMSWLSVNVKTALGEQAESPYKEEVADSNPASPTFEK